MVEHSGTSISSGFLRTKISLKGNQSQLSLVSPFYGMKPELPPHSQLLGSEDLISLLDLNGSYNRYCGPKKPKEDLASFLPHVCGAAQINKKADASCSLRQLIEKPPIMGKEINNLTASQMTGFKLTPGPVPDAYRYFDLTNIPIELATTSVIQQQQQHSMFDPKLQKEDGTDIRFGTRVKRSLDELDDGERKFKKHKGDDKEKSEKKKRKKDKKKKKEKEREKKNDEARLHVKKEPTTLASSAITPFF
ncbi:hypothetical protein ACQ4LE_007682 [Meloidogyne hapla]|uniref:Mediator of RNA polymerase II transcription subunit 19 n=1 Tax=Meloidogyne hapla TaxID=6305 RepID=A0A1I8BT05_MELHA